MMSKVLTSPIHNLRIEFPPVGSLARRSIHRGQLGKRYKRRSVKSPKYLLKLESKSEYIYSCILDCAYWINSIQEQPALIKYLCNENNLIKKHYPDFLITSQDGRMPTFIEVKSDAIYVHREIENRTAQLMEQLPYMGYEYKFITLNEIPLTLINNCHLLLRLSRFSHLRQENLHRFYNDCSFKKIKWGEFNIEEKILLSNLFLQGLVGLDMLNPIESKTVITWAQPLIGEESWHKYL